MEAYPFDQALTQVVHGIQINWQPACYQLQQDNAKAASDRGKGISLRNGNLTDDVCSSFVCTCTHHSSL